MSRDEEPHYTFEVEGDHDPEEAEVRLICGCVALVWHHNRGEVRTFQIKLLSGRERISATSPHGVQGELQLETELLTFWPDAIRHAAKVNEASFPILLMMHSAHEAMHLVQKARGDTLSASRDTTGELHAGYINDPLEREAREVGLHVAKYFEPNLGGMLLAEDGTEEHVPAESMFKIEVPKMEIHVDIP